MKASGLSVAACSILLIAAPFVATNATATTPVTIPSAINPDPEDPDGDPIRLISDYVDAMNAGDLARAAHLFTTHAVIIDPFPPPHIFHSFSSWHAALVRVQRSRHLSDFHMRAMSPLSVGSSSYGNAYCDVPIIISLKMNGEPRTSRGIATITAVRTAQGWRINGFATASIELESFWKTFQADSTPPQ